MLEVGQDYSDMMLLAETKVELLAYIRGVEASARKWFDETEKQIRKKVDLMEELTKKEAEILKIEKHFDVYESRKKEKERDMDRLMGKIEVLRSIIDDNLGMKR